MLDRLNKIKVEVFVLKKFQMKEWDLDKPIEEIVQVVETLYPKTIGHRVELLDFVKNVMIGAKHIDLDQRIKGLSVELNRLKKREQLVKLSKTTPKMPEGKGNFQSNVKSFNELRDSIQSDGVFSVAMDFNPEGITSQQTINSYYNKLIGKKVLSEDPELMNDILRYKKEILQHRISATIYLYENGIEMARLRVFSCLLEHKDEMGNFWQGKKIDYFKQLVFLFNQEMKKYGITNVVIEKEPERNKKFTITSLNFNFDFV